MWVSLHLFGRGFDILRAHIFDIKEMLEKSLPTVLIEFKTKDVKGLDIMFPCFVMDVL